MNDEDLMHVQRQLRIQLLDTPQKVTPGSSDLAAHMLLYLDDAHHCWRLAAQWLRNHLDADHVDGGFASPGLIYRPTGHALRSGASVPAMDSLEFAPDDAAMLTVWRTPGAVLFEDIDSDARFAAHTRDQLLATGTRAKLAMAIRDDTAPVGLMCCNWSSLRVQRKYDLSRQVADLSSRILGPIFAAAWRLGRDEKHAAATVPAAGLLAELTPGEIEVARLVVTGMSYKEIAARLNRSFSTVDHRLRAIREKSGARSTARMVAILRDLFSGHH